MLPKFHTRIFENKWPSELGGVLLAFLNILLLLYATRPIGGVIATLSTWGKWMQEIVLLNIQTPGSILRPPSAEGRDILTYGFVFGVFFTALLANQFRLRREGGYIQGLTGGLLMGIGGSLAGGCTLGAFYSSVMSLSLSGFIVMAGLMIGSYIGGRFMMWQIDRQAEKLFNQDACHMKKQTAENSGKDAGKSRKKAAVITALFIIAATALLFLIGRRSFAIMLLFGVSFGVVFQRSAFCITAAFREMFMTRSTRMMQSLLISLAIGIVGFTIIKASGTIPADMYVFQSGWYNLAGSIMFGFGMTITGG
ncbi:MAG: hypothetical protein C4560_06940 [Nitrospiraceae bacterium]|nr:MAG: hypothetical protein C4560_06940 [Nitrospiraceae bacterium]